MTVREIVEILEAKIITGEHLIDKDVSAACGSDVMSDVLAYVKNQAVLLTGLCNSQVIRTAEVMDIICIIFVRGKIPDQQMIKLADDGGIALLATEQPMFTACGMLYDRGLPGGDSK